MPKSKKPSVKVHENVHPFSPLWVKQHMQSIIAEDISEYNLIFLVFCFASMLPNIQTLPYI